MKILKGDNTGDSTHSVTNYSIVDVFQQQSPAVIQPVQCYKTPEMPESQLNNTIRPMPSLVMYRDMVRNNDKSRFTPIHERSSDTPRSSVPSQDKLQARNRSQKRGAEKKVTFGPDNIQVLNDHVLSPTNQHYVPYHQANKPTLPTSSRSPPPLVLPQLPAISVPQYFYTRDHRLCITTHLPASQASQLYINTIVQSHQCVLKNLNLAHFNLTHSIDQQNQLLISMTESTYVAQQTQQVQTFVQEPIQNVQSFGAPQPQHTQDAFSASQPIESGVDVQARDSTQISQVQGMQTTLGHEMQQGVDVDQYAMQQYTNYQDTAPQQLDVDNIMKTPLLTNDNNQLTTLSELLGGDDADLFSSPGSFATDFDMNELFKHISDNELSPIKKTPQSITADLDSAKETDAPIHDQDTEYNEAETFDDAEERPPTPRIANGDGESDNESVCSQSSSSSASSSTSSSSSASSQNASNHSQVFESVSESVDFAENAASAAAAETEMRNDNYNENNNTGDDDDEDEEAEMTSDDDTRDKQPTEQAEDKGADDIVVDTDAKTPTDVENDKDTAPDGTERETEYDLDRNRLSESQIIDKSKEKEFSTEVHGYDVTKHSECTKKLKYIGKPVFCFSQDEADDMCISKNGDKFKNTPLSLQKYANLYNEEFLAESAAFMERVNLLSFIEKKDRFVGMQLKDHPCLPETGNQVADFYESHCDNIDKTNIKSNVTDYVANINTNLLTHRDAHYTQTTLQVLLAPEQCQAPDTLTFDEVKLIYTYMQEETLVPTSERITTYSTQLSSIFAKFFKLVTLPSYEKRVGFKDYELKMMDVETMSDVRYKRFVNPNNAIKTELYDTFQMHLSNSTDVSNLLALPVNRKVHNNDKIEKYYIKPFASPLVMKRVSKFLRDVVQTSYTKFVNSERGKESSRYNFQKGEEMSLPMGVVELLTYSCYIANMQDPFDISTDMTPAVVQKNVYNPIKYLVYVLINFLKRVSKLPDTITPEVLEKWQRVVVSLHYTIETANVTPRIMIATLKMHENTILSMAEYANDYEIELPNKIECILNGIYNKQPNVQFYMKAKSIIKYLGHSQLIIMAHLHKPKIDFDELYDLKGLLREDHLSQVNPLCARSVESESTISAKLHEMLEILSRTVFQAFSRHVIETEDTDLDFNKTRIIRDGISKLFLHKSFNYVPLNAINLFMAHFNEASIVHCINHFTSFALMDSYYATYDVIKPGSQIIVPEFTIGVTNHLYAIICYHFAKIYSNFMQVRTNNSHLIRSTYLEMLETHAYKYIEEQFKAIDVYYKKDDTVEFGYYMRDDAGKKRIREYCITSRPDGKKLIDGRVCETKTTKSSVKPAHENLLRYTNNSFPESEVTEHVFHHNNYYDAYNHDFSDEEEFLDIEEAEVEVTDDEDDKVIKITHMESCLRELAVLEDDEDYELTDTYYRKRNDKQLPVELEVYDDTPNRTEFIAKNTLTPDDVTDTDSNDGVRPPKPTKAPVKRKASTDTAAASAAAAVAIESDELKTTIKCVAKKLKATTSPITVAKPKPSATRRVPMATSGYGNPKVISFERYGDEHSFTYHYVSDEFFNADFSQFSVPNVRIECFLCKVSKTGLVFGMNLDKIIVVSCKQCMVAFSRDYDANLSILQDRIDIYKPPLMFSVDASRERTLLPDKSSKLQMWTEKEDERPYLNLWTPICDTYELRVDTITNRSNLPTYKAKKRKRDADDIVEAQKSKRQHARDKKPVAANVNVYDFTDQNSPPRRKIKRLRTSSELIDPDTEPQAMYNHSVQEVGNVKQMTICMLNNLKRIKRMHKATTSSESTKSNLHSAGTELQSAGKNAQPATTAESKITSAETAESQITSVKTKNAHASADNKAKSKSTSASADNKVKSKSTSASANTKTKTSSASVDDKVKHKTSSASVDDKVKYKPSTDAKAKFKPSSASSKSHALEHAKKPTGDKTKSTKHEKTEKPPSDKQKTKTSAIPNDEYIPTCTDENYAEFAKQIQYVPLPISGDKYKIPRK